MVSAPENFEVTDIPRLELDDVVRVYTLPYQTANMKIDTLTHECLVQLLHARRGIRVSIRYYVVLCVFMCFFVDVGPCIQHIVRFLFFVYVPAC